MCKLHFYKFLPGTIVGYIENTPKDINAMACFTFYLEMQYNVPVNGKKPLSLNYFRLFDHQIPNRYAWKFEYHEFGL